MVYPIISAIPTENIYNLLASANQSPELGDIILCDWLQPMVRQGLRRGRLVDVWTLRHYESFYDLVVEILNCPLLHFAANFKFPPTHLQPFSGLLNEHFP